MKDFPDFMKHPLNRIDPNSQSEGIEGYVYDGLDNSQMAFWKCYKDGISKEHVHDYDEYFIVVEGQYDLIINNQKIVLTPGKEYFISKGTPHSGKFYAGTRTIHAFGGKRVLREVEVKRENSNSG